MATLHITQLPSDILIDIFRLVERKDLFQLTIVCKLFNNVISNSSVLLLEMPLNFNKFNVRQKFIGTRKYSNVIVSGEKLMGRLRNIKSIAGSIVKFQLRHEMSYGRRCKESWEKFMIADLVDLLRVLPKLRHLSILPPYWLESRALKNKYALNLKLDSLSGSPDHLFPLFYNCSMKEFSLNQTKNYYGCPELIEFLKSQKDLQRLFINSINVRLFKDNSLTNVDFKLKKLKLDYSTHSHIGDNADEIANVVQFLQQFRESLEMLEIHDYNEQIWRMLPEFKKLKELKVCCNGNFENLPGLSLPSVERLHVRNFNSFPNSVFPNLKHLNIINNKETNTR